MPAPASPEQIAIVERLQLKTLKRLEAMLDNGSITSTDMATLVRLLSANGWNLDPNAVPAGLRGKLKELSEDPRNLDNEDGYPQ